MLIYVGQQGPQQIKNYYCDTFFLMEICSSSFEIKWKESILWSKLNITDLRVTLFYDYIYLNDVDIF